MAGGNGTAVQLQDGVLRELIANDFGFWQRSDLMRILQGDPRKDIDAECGYPSFILPIQYRALYDREGIAQRVVNLWPRECWAADPKIQESRKDDEKTEFDAKLDDVIQETNLLHYMERIDEMSGISMFGLLLIGLDDGLPLDQPVEGIDLETGEREPGFNKERKITFMRTFDQSLITVLNYETNPLSRRFGQPNYYNVRFVDVWSMSYEGFIPITGGLIQRVHWTRVVHIVDNRLTSEIFGVPRMQPIWNRLYDIRKILGADGEGFYKAGFPGLSLETHPGLEAPEFDEGKTKEAMFNYMNGLQRYLMFTGVSVKPLAPQIADPSPHFKTQLQAICIAIDVPMRIFLGAEEAKLASQQDKHTWNRRLQRRQTKYIAPLLIRAVVDRLIAMGVVPLPKKTYYVTWPDLTLHTEEEKATSALKRTAAMAQYVGKFVETAYPLFEYLTDVQGLDPEKAMQIVDKVRKKGKNGRIKPLLVAPKPAGANGAVKGGANAPTKGWSAVDTSYSIDKDIGNPASVNNPLD